MENIEIYRSRKKNIIILLVCIAFVCVCVYLTEKDKIARIVGWIGIAFFGACAVALLYAFLRERLLHKPFLVITDSEVRMDGGFKLHSFRFSEVERFIWANVNDVLFITAVLNERAERRKMTDASPAGRFFHRANIRLTGGMENIQADNLTVKPNELFDMLNQRLEAYRQAHPAD